MRTDTCAFKYLQARTLPAQWALLSRERKAYAAHLVRDYGTPVRIAIQQAYIFGPSAYAYDYRTGKSVRDQWPARATRPRHYYAISYAYDGAISDSDMVTRFDSHAARAAFCERHPMWEPVTVAEIRHRFDVSAFNDRDRHQHADQYMPARIYQRPGYIL